MTEIEARVEGTNVVLPDYSGRTFSDEAIDEGEHRRFVTGKGADWDEGGANQLRFLCDQGLAPEHRLIDIGAGALRAGRHFVDYLKAGNYYGVDANQQLLQLGYDRELSPEQRDRLPIENLRANDRFDVDFGVRFDTAIAQSVFTHVSLNHIRLCLFRLAAVMEPGSVFYASFFKQPNTRPIDHTFQYWKKGRTYFYEKNVFWYHRSDLRLATHGLPWQFRYVGDYGSTQSQVMASFTRLDDARLAAREQRRAADLARLREQRRREHEVQAQIDAGGSRAFVLRARRKAARIISPY